MVPQLHPLVKKRKKKRKAKESKGKRKERKLSERKGKRNKKLLQLVLKLVTNRSGTDEPLK